MNKYLSRNKLSSCSVGLSDARSVITEKQKRISQCERILKETTLNKQSRYVQCTRYETCIIHNTHSISEETQSLTHANYAMHVCDCRATSTYAHSIHITHALHAICVGCGLSEYVYSQACLTSVCMYA